MTSSKETSVMLGSKSGVAARLKELNPKVSTICAYKNSFRTDSPLYECICIVVKTFMMVMC